MKKTLSTAIFTALSGIASAQLPALYNNGAILYVSKDTYVQVNGDLINREGSNLENGGILATNGSVINDVPMTQADAGELLLEGDTPAIIGGSPIFATNVTVNNPAGFTLNTPLRISGQMTFTAGVLTIPDSINAFIFESGASVNPSVSPSNLSHINGFISREGNGPFTYPSGNGAIYQPVGVNLTANSDGLVARYVAGNAGDGPFTTKGSSSTPLVARNMLEYWSLSPVGNATGTVTIYWDEDNNTGIANTADLAVAHLSGGNWLNEGANGTSGTTNTGFVVSNSISTWSPFTLGSIANSSPLPVRLIAFTARQTEGAVALKWRIADAKAFSHFEIERALNAKAFEKVGQVVYDGSMDFNFTDIKAMSSLATELYYRLKLVDSDGSFAYSGIESVSTQDAFDVVAYPNPVVETIYLKAPEWSKVSGVKLFNSQGQVLYSSGSNPPQHISAKALKTGFYFVRLTHADGTETTRKIAIEH